MTDCRSPPYQKTLTLLTQFLVPPTRYHHLIPLCVSWLVPWIKWYLLLWTHHKGGYLVTQFEYLHCFLSLSLYSSLLASQFHRSLFVIDFHGPISWSPLYLYWVLVYFSLRSGRCCIQRKTLMSYSRQHNFWLFLTAWKWRLWSLCLLFSSTLTLEWMFVLCTLFLLDSLFSLFDFHSIPSRQSPFLRQPALCVWRVPAAFPKLIQSIPHFKA